VIPRGTLLYVEGCTVSFDGFRALRQLDLLVDRAERIRLLIGPNGAGKTTLFDVLTGHVVPVAGRVLFDGAVDLLGLPSHAIANLGVVRKFQTPSVFPGHTVLENMTLAAGHKAFTSVVRVGRRAADHDAIAAALARVGLLDRAAQPAGTLSHGEKQWLEIAMLLVQAPRLLLLDEPVAGMTRAEKTRTAALLEAVVAPGDCTVMVIEHDMEFVRRLAGRGHRVTVLTEGSVLAEGALAQVQADQRVVDAYLGRGRVTAEPACSR
jgi:urea transport system ATP-binding protein